MIGKSLAHYEIIGLLGKGGMGEVYRARDEKLDREIALKILPEEFAADPARLRRFESEARTVAGLNHPNIVMLHSVEEADGLHFLTMELVEGEGLDRAAKPGGLPLERALDAAVALADALSAAHGKGVVHRDLKPANVMLTTDDRVKVLDFGLAKLVADTTGEDARTQALAMTGEGTVLGTVPYMSPEQLRGDAVDHRSDIFSFGILLFELVTGQRPFGGGSNSEISSSILRDTAPPIAAIKPDLPRHLGRIVARCLEKDPRQRYQRTPDLKNDLAGLKKEIESGLMGPYEGSTGSGTRKRWTFALVAILLAGAAGYFVTRGTGPPEGRSPDSAGGVPPTSIAVLPFTNLSSDAEQEFFSDGLTEELLTTLARVPDLQVAGRSSCFSFKGKNPDLGTVGAKLNVAYVLEGSVRKADDRIRISAQLTKADDGFQLWSESYDRQLDDVFAIQADVAQRVSDALAVELMPEQRAALAARRTDSPEAHSAYLKGRFHWNQRTANEIRRATDYFRTAIRLDPAYAQAYAGLAEALAVLPDYATDADMDSVSRQVREAAETAMRLDPALGQVRATIGLVESYRGNREEAARILVEVLDDYPRYASGRQWYAWNLLYMRRYDEAIAQIRKARELDPLSSIITSNVGQFLFHAGRFEEALVEIDRCLEADPGFLVARRYQAMILTELGDYERALRLQETLLEEIDYPEGLSQLAYIHALRGDAASADRALQEIVSRYAPLDHIERAIPLAALDRTEEAFALVQEACESGGRRLRIVQLHPGRRFLERDSRFEEIRDCLDRAS